jgi:AraC-like DNA-binding protein
MLNYSEISAQDSMKHYIRKFWVLDHAGIAIFSEARHALPNGCCTLAFITGEGIILGDTHIKAGIYFFGQITRRLKIVVKPYTKAIMAQLNPWAPGLITKLPLHELTNSFASLDLVNPALYRAFSKVDITDENVLVQNVYRELEDYFRETNDSRLIHSVIGAFTPGSLLKIADIAADTGYSKRYLEKKFSQHIGLSPKEMYSILRLRSVIDALPQPKFSLTQLALQYGYFDQSHFIKIYTGVMESLPGKFEITDYILPHS